MFDRSKVCVALFLVLLISLPFPMSARVTPCRVLRQAKSIHGRGLLPLHVPVPVLPPGDNGPSAPLP